MFVSLEHQFRWKELRMIKNDKNLFHILSSTILLLLLDILNDIIIHKYLWRINFKTFTQTATARGLLNSYLVPYSLLGNIWDWTVSKEYMPLNSFLIEFPISFVTSRDRSTVSWQQTKKTSSSPTHLSFSTCLYSTISPSKNNQAILPRYLKHWYSPLS